MNKRILVTGMNKAQCTRNYFLSQQLKVVPSHYSLIRCLEDMGWEVDQREVSLGEDLSSYDEMIFYIHSPQAYAQCLYTGLYALSQRPNAIIAFDDWQINQIYTSLRRFEKEITDRIEDPYREFLLDLQMTKNPPDELKKYESNYLEALRVLNSRSNRLLVSAFAGGDLGLLNLNWTNDWRVFAYNPNPYHLNRKPENNFESGSLSLFETFVNPEDKKREWNFASLVQNKTKSWLKKQDPKWEINFYGSRRGQHKSERLTEDQMCKVFSEQWGCLMPGYFNSGSGWWRARPLQVADAGSILVGEPRELEVFYQDKNLSNVTARNIESLDLEGLKNFAKMQREALYDVHPLDKAVQRREIEAILSCQ